MQHIQIVAFLFIISMLLAGCTFPSVQQDSTQVEENNPENQEASEDAIIKQPTSYTLAEVSIHNRADNCWQVIEGKVYDVTSFIANKKHPGGEAILLGCGKDATELYNDRPNESGAHSERARSLLKDYEIGVLSK